VNAFVAAGAGFLLAVLWFDLMFDVQVRAQPSGTLPEAVLASIAGYYARVVVASRPMNRLIAVVMLATLAAIIVEIADGDDPAWVAWLSLVLATGAVVRARVRTVPDAVRFGRRSDSPEQQSALARSIYRDHVACFTAILAVLVLQLASA
jgi:hypothetical protein